MVTGDVPTRSKRPQKWTIFPFLTLVAGDLLERVLGDKAIAAGVAGPEIAHYVVGQEGGRLGRDHGVGTDRAGREVAAARGRMRRLGRTGSKCWHRDLLAIHFVIYHCRQ